MKSYKRGQTTITYEIEGDGHQILLLAPGGMRSANNFWNNGGWEFEEEVRMNAAECTSGNMYRFETLHNAGE